ncbi:HNH endonuclease signature motif containing protein [Corynebacterium riegelii]|uniref:HNH endonuclease signature motif containing protein n=1 Tax=Corynebacterium riegelii TaxID=156976 RepID=UPI00068E76EE|nr:HNH endonuclease signature motif containing protein [Corynebacterium riegelii]
MTSFAGLIASQSVDALADFDRDTALAARLSSTLIADWEMVHKAYFGTRADREALVFARANQVPLEQLITIEKALLRIDDPSNHPTARLHLLAQPRSPRGLKAAIRELIPREEKPYEQTASFSRSRCRTRSLRVALDERLMADLEHHLRRDIDPSRPAGPQMAANFARLLNRDGTDGTGAGAGTGDASTSGTGAAASTGADAGAGTGDANAGAGAGAGVRVAAAAPRPVVLVPLPEHVKLLGRTVPNPSAGASGGAGSGHSGSAGSASNGASAEDVLLGLSDGTTITGAEYLALHHGAELEVALFHPVEGAVDAYRGRRYANAKQRLLAKLVSPTCAWPDCKTAAEHCEAHHVTPWKHGGNTNMDNLTMLCSYHNRVNDDDPGVTGGLAKRRRRAGHITLIRGRPAWQPEWGPPIENTAGPPGAMRLLFGAIKR